LPLGSSDISHQGTYLAVYMLAVALLGDLLEILYIGVLEEIHFCVQLDSNNRYLKLVLESIIITGTA